MGSYSLCRCELESGNRSKSMEKNGNVWNPNTLADSNNDSNDNPNYFSNGYSHHYPNTDSNCDDYSNPDNFANSCLPSLEGRYDLQSWRSGHLLK